MSERTRTVAARIAVTVGMLLVTAPAAPLAPEKAVTQYGLESWQIADGLPQNSILDIVQTRDGFLWLATYEGVARFDGRDFTTFEAPAFRAIRDQYVLALREDRSGRLWLGTQDGLHCLDGGKLASYTVADGLASNVVQALHEDRSGRLWIGTQDGLDRFEQGRFVHVGTASGLAHPDVRVLLEDRRGELWIGTQRGLSRFGSAGIATWTTADGLAHDGITSLLEDRQGSLWIGTQGGGLIRFRDGRFTTSTAARGDLPSDFISALYQDRRGNLWIGTQDRGLARASEDGRFERFGKAHGLTDDHVTSLLEDHEGNLWVGTFSGGLNRLTDGKFTPLTTWQGLPDDLVLPILEDRHGDLWLGTQAGLARLRDGELETWTTADGLGHNFVWSLHEDHRDVLWIGTWGGGLSRFENGSFSTLTTADGLAHDDVRALLEDRAHDLWIGTWGGGLNRLHDGRLTLYGEADGLASQFVTALFEDRDGTLWIGTNGGLSRLRDGELTSYTTADGFAHNVILSFYQDRNGTLWIGSEGGLNRLRDGEVAVFTTDDGLFNNRFFSIFEDHRGFLWTSCNKGIFRVDKKELEAVAAGLLDRVTSVVYGTGDGMKSHECNGGYQPAGWQARDGKLWFPTIRGAVAIDPERIAINEAPPPVVIDRLLLDHESIPLDRLGGAAVEIAGKDFEVHYTAPSFVDPAEVGFRYRLEGYDTGWVEAGTRRTAFYTNIPPGRYRFRVIAHNDDGVWNDDGDGIEIYRRPAFHETSAFYFMTAVAMTCVLWGGHRLRVRRLLRHNQALRNMRLELESKNVEIEAKNDDLSRFTYTVSHDLKSPLVTILGYLGFMEKDLRAGHLERALADVGRIRAAASKMGELLDELLELSRIGRLEKSLRWVALEDLAKEVVELLSGQISERGVEVVVSDLPTVVADRPRLTAVLQNLIGNAVKFMGSQSAPRVEIGVAGDALRRAGETPVIYVRDNGIGIAPEYHQKIFELFDQLDPASGGSGAGLAIVQRVIEHHGGRIWVASEEGAGSTFYFTLSSKLRPQAEEPVAT